MLRHQRRLQLLKAKRGNERHREYLYKLENLMSVAEFDVMTVDKMAIHLSAETEDRTELRTKVKETENSIWYRSCMKK